MSLAKKADKNKQPMSEIDAIYKRRAIRNYKPEKLDEDTINLLLNAAVQAPTSAAEEPWSFVVIQDKELLNQLSDSIKALIHNEARNYPKQMKNLLDTISDPEFHSFYNASTLIVIYNKFQGQFISADCWLAAENLMLTACAQGLGTCVIGLALSALNSPQWKSLFNVPSETTAIAPIIVGIPAENAPPIQRKKPEILSWK